MMQVYESNALEVFMKSCERGRSMIEMLGVLAIIGVLSAAGLAGYSKAMAKHKINKTVDQMANIINNMRTAYYGKNAGHPYADFGQSKEEALAGMKNAVALRVFPEEMVQDKETPKVYNAYKGEVYIITRDQGETFEVVFENLPRQASIAIGTMDWGTQDITGLQELLINDDEVTTAEGD